MHPFALIILSVVLMAMFVAGLFLINRARSGRVAAFNTFGDGTREGPITFTAAAVISARNLLVTRNAAGTVSLCGLNGIPWGPAIDEAAAIGDPIAVEMLGAARRTLLGVSSMAITDGDFLIPAANGQIRTLTGVAAGNHYVMGRAVGSTAGAGETFEYVPYAPQLRVVT